ncbi:Bifunctional heparan sulfate N-deacetylase/N-sulfotransferase-like isoform X2 [Oopsacas minuta]|uniref:Bifunctional heparan sulfate N-deacetylase/N-sulfotransferase-like isoform X2 n=1 Tax=Oopsacas minuta TaxID=111878 RepID=A0AAV7KAG4_9METZ|nr:Bifunctional heparan sulfate N-deacetylase/N-sulfotransferase-like isoform X2 [Oopsacas minuta]
MTKDLEFSSLHNLSITTTGYSVTPHHSGVYPIYLPLYKSWQKLGYVTVTSTEQYPTLWPHHLRRGLSFDTSTNYFKELKEERVSFIGHHVVVVCLKVCCIIL